MVNIDSFLPVGSARLEVDITYATTAEERQEGLSSLPPGA